MENEEPSNDRAVLKHQGEVIAEAWFESEGSIAWLVLQVPRERLGSQLSLETLLAAAAVPMDEAESWTLDGLPDSVPDGHDPLPQPTEGIAHLVVRVRLKAGGAEEEISAEKWQLLETCWKTILGLEATIDSTRLSMESLRSEMESAFKRPLAVEEKMNALQADIAQWTKAKSRVHHSIPKLKEFIHRAVWALAVPERKRLEEVYKNHILPRNPLPDVDRVREQLEHLQKDRQVLLAQGNAVNQECRGILGEIQRAVGTLQRNAVENARRKRDAKGQRGKQF